MLLYASIILLWSIFSLFFFNDTATTEIYTLSLHDALPISLLCTADHKILTQNRGWVQAQNLNPGDSIISLNRGALKAGGKHHPYISWTGNAHENGESRYVYQEIHDIELGKNDHVHHKNLIPSDNRPENLECLTQSKHSRLHRKLEEKTGFALLSEEEHHKFDESRSRGHLKSLSSESRKKRSVSVKTYWDSLTSEQRAIRNHKVLQIGRAHV